jgi:urocanate hydratase
MGYSPLKYKIEEAKARHEHEKTQLAAKHKKEMNDLMNQCTHKYEDGSSAVNYYEGIHRMDFGKECAICKRRM